MYETLKIHTFAPMKMIQYKFHGQVFSMNFQLCLHVIIAVYETIMFHNDIYISLTITYYKLSTHSKTTQL